MTYGSKLPEWLFYDFWSVITAGEIYPQIRAIAASYLCDTRELFVRCYLDRKPTDFDRDSIGSILSLLASRYSNKAKLSNIRDECVYSSALIKDLDPLDGFVYTRREYEMQDNPSNQPTYFTPDT